MLHAQIGLCHVRYDYVHSFVFLGYNAGPNLGIAYMRTMCMPVRRLSSHRVSSASAGKFLTFAQNRNNIDYFGFAQCTADLTLDLSPSRAELQIGLCNSSIHSWPQPRRKHPASSVPILSGLRGWCPASSSSVFPCFPPDPSSVYGTFDKVWIDTILHSFFWDTVYIIYLRALEIRFILQLVSVNWCGTAFWAVLWDYQWRDRISGSHWSGDVLLGEMNGSLGWVSVRRVLRVGGYTVLLMVRGVEKYKGCWNRRWFIGIGLTE